MANKQTGLYAPDGSQYVTITDGSLTLLPNPGNSGLSNMVTSQVTVGATATLVAAARTARSSITITNLGTVDVFLGGVGVTLANGVLLVGTKGASVTLPVNAAVYGICATTQAVSVLEAY